MTTGESWPLTFVVTVVTVSPMYSQLPDVFARVIILSRFVESFRRVYPLDVYNIANLQNSTHFLAKNSERSRSRRPQGTESTTYSIRCLTLKTEPRWLARCNMLATDGVRFLNVGATAICQLLYRDVYA